MNQGSVDRLTGVENRGRQEHKDLRKALRIMASLWSHIPLTVLVDPSGARRKLEDLIILLDAKEEQ
jgi:hypothetical protein